MGSKQKQTRQLQKEKFEQLLAKRTALLLEKGMDMQKIAKDKVIKHLRAEVNRTVNAIDSISAREKLIEKAKIQKQKNAEKVKADKSKPKKKKAESAPEGKDKKEKKKKKTGKQ